MPVWVRKQTVMVMFGEFGVKENPFGCSVRVNFTCPGEVSYKQALPSSTGSSSVAYHPFGP